MDNKKVNLQAAFAKTVETDDGGREVWGFATLERVDKSKEIADFDGTVKAFEKWANETEQRTGGKSKGNVRLMHQPIAVGKAIHWEPTETTIEEDGVEKTVKGIWVGAYVPPTKPDVIKDIDEGILSAFSIGGSYEKRWWDPDEQAFRYIPNLSEYSLVDNPACEGADIVNVISKQADVPWQKENIMGEELKKGREPKGTLEELKAKLYSAVECCQALMGNGYSWCDCSIVATYPSSVVVYEYRQGKYFELPYSFNGEDVILGDPVEVAQTYVPLEISADEGTMKASRNMFLEKAIESFNQKADPEAKEMGEQLAKSATSLKGGDYIFKDGKVLEKKEGEKTTMNPEQLAKAAEAAGLTMEQVANLFKAIAGEEVQKANIDEPTPNPTVTTVDGDGDLDGNKEFPNPPDEPINIEGEQAKVKAAEEESGVKEKPAAKAAEGELAKAGKSISKQNGIEIAHAVGHLAAVQKGTTYTADDHLKLVGEAGQGGTGEEPPMVDVEKMFTDILSPIVEAAVAKTVESVMSKSAEAALQKSAGETEKIESLVKGLASQEDLKKAMVEMESIKTMVKEIHETPQSGGPAFNGAMMKGFNFTNIAAQEDSTLEKFVSEINDPMLKDRVGQEIAMRKAKEAFK